MATQHEEGGDGEKVIIYDYYLGRWSGEEPAAMADCPQCAGKGTVLLLVTAKRCEACGGTGKVSPQAGVQEPGDTQDYEVTTYVFDADGELIDKIVGDAEAGGAASAA